MIEISRPRESCLHRCQQDDRQVRRAVWRTTPSFSSFSSVSSSAASSSSEGSSPPQIAQVFGGSARVANWSAPLAYPILFASRSWHTCTTYPQPDASDQSFVKKSLHQINDITMPSQSPDDSV